MKKQTQLMGLLLIAISLIACSREVPKEKAKTTAAASQAARVKPQHIEEYFESLYPLGQKVVWKENCVIEREVENEQTHEVTRSKMTKPEKISEVIMVKIAEHVYEVKSQSDERIFLERIQFLPEGLTETETLYSSKDYHAEEKTKIKNGISK